MSEYRLDDLIREGAEISEETIGRLVRRDGEKAKACAYGAAQLGLETKEECDNNYKNIDDLWNLHHSLWMLSSKEILSKDIPKKIGEYGYEPIEGPEWKIYEIIYLMNDYTKYSRKGISEYVCWLIDEKGYNLTVSIDDEDNDEEQEEEEEEERELQPA